MDGRFAALVDPATTAIVVVDVQNDFCHPDGACAKNGAATDAAMAMIPTLQTLLDAGRRFGAKIVFIQTVHTPETDSAAWTGRMGGSALAICRKDTWGGAFTDVGPLAGEPVVQKHRYSAFVNTRLDSVLRTYKIETLVMTGVSTNVCVESTARQGFMLDYNVVIAADCCAAYSPAEHDASLQILGRAFGTVAASADIIGAWTAGRLLPA